MDLLAEERERQRLEKLYAGMSDGELQELAVEAGSLTEAAVQALSQEIEGRGLDIALVESAVSQNVVEKRELSIIRHFRDMHEALLAKGLLESAGIECFLVDDNMVRLDWFLSNLVGGIKLAVKADDAGTAVEVLQQPVPENFDFEGAGSYEQPRCPRCGSIDISHVAGIDKRFALPALFVVSFPIPVGRDIWKCSSCGAQWQELPDDAEKDGEAE